MLAASHALLGASLARLLPDPWLALPLNLAGHFLADLVPHWDMRTRHTPRSKTAVIILSLADAAAGFFAGWLIFGRLVPPPYLFIMMFVAQLPDWLEAPYHIFDWNFAPFSSIKHLQSRLHRKLGLPWGLIGQVGLVAAIVRFSL